MIQYEISYAAQKYFLQLDISSTDRVFSKYQKDNNFINKLLSKQIYRLTDSTNYIVEDCFPSILGSTDTTELYVKNRNINDIGNIVDIETDLNHNKLNVSTFNRGNKITDLSYLHSQPNPSFDNIQTAQSLLTKKIINSILITDNSMQLVTLSNVSGDVMFDESFSNDYNNINLTQPESHWNEKILSLSYEKPFRGTQNIYLDINTNPTIYDTSTEYSSISGRYLLWTPNITGWYKISHFVYHGGAYTPTIMIYKNYIGEPATTTSLTTMPGQLDEQRYIYLNAGEPTLIKYLQYNYSGYSSYKKEPLLNLQIKYMTSIENINLVSCDVVFENSGGEPIDTYHYNGITYNIDELKNKIIVQILNVYTQLVIFNTTGTFFEEHEKYAINKFCLINFDFVNSIYPALRQSIKKSLEIKE